MLLLDYQVRKEEGLHKDSERLRSQRKNKRGAFDHTKSLADDLNEGVRLLDCICAR